MRNKRGWIRILEATISVLIVSVVLIVIYSRQVGGGGEQADYFYSLQRQILMDISSDSDLRMMVLEGRENELRDFVDSRIPLAFSYFLRICEIGVDFCKIDDVDVIRAVQDKSVFVEDVIVSAELGDGSEVVYSPKKVRLFVWEGKR